MANVTREEKLVYIKTGTILGLVAVLFLIWIWWARVYTSKSNVFNAMLSNSLTTRGITKSVSEDQQGGKTQQISQAQFGAVNLVESKTEVTQTGQNGDVKVQTQILASPTEDFVRYSSIDVPASEGKPKIDFSSLYSVWGKTIKAEGGGAPFTEAVYGIVPFGNLPTTQRNQLLSIMHSKNVYKTDYTKAEVKSENGRSVYVYQVDVNLQGYTELLKTYDAMLGLNQMQQLNPSDYMDAEPIKVTITVDKLSRTLSKIAYENGRQESLAGFGIHRQVDLPKDTASRQDVEAKLQELLTAGQ